MKDIYISVIVLNYNGIAFLKENIESILTQSYLQRELIVVDNASTDGSLELLGRYSEQLTIIRNEKNLGFAANNCGMRVARGDYYLILNNDTVLDTHMLAEAVRVMKEYPDGGMFAPKILQKNMPHYIDSVGLLIYRDGMSRQRGRFEKDEGQYDSVEEVFVPSGCAGFYKREMVEEIGGIDEDFFAYCEDTDFGFRGRLAGWKTYSVPKSCVYHHFSGSWGKNYGMKAFLVERNHMWFALKCFSVSLLIAAPFFTVYRYCVQVYGLLANKGIGGQFIRSEGQGAWRLFLILIRANIAALIGLPRMLRKRRVIQSKRKVSARDMRVWFGKYGMSAKELVLRD